MAVEFLTEEGSELQISTYTRYRRAAVSWMTTLVLHTGITDSEEKAQKILIAVAVFFFVVAASIFIFKAQAPQGSTGPASPSLKRHMMEEARKVFTTPNAH